MTGSDDAAWRTTGRRRLLGTWMAVALTLGAAVGVGAAAVAKGSADRQPSQAAGSGTGAARSASTSSTTVGAADPAVATTARTAPGTATPAAGGSVRLTLGSTVTADGIGPVRVGMTIEQAERAGRVRLERKYLEYAPRCFYVVPARWPKRRDGDVLVDQLGLMVVDGRIARVDVWAGRTRTSTGIRIGSTEADVQRAYPGRIEVTGHAYEGPTGHYLTYVPPGAGDRRIVFETDGEQVTRYRAGKLPAVRMVEGCA